MYPTPTLDTGRLLLRPIQATDLMAFFAMWQEPAFYQHLTGQPSSEEDCWRRLLLQAGTWLLLGYGYWAVEEKGSGEFIGCMGFADFYRDLEPSLKGYPEIGWVLAPRVHGQGYATEAARAALDWADAHLPGRRTVCIIDPANYPSRRLAARLGYQELVVSTYKEKPIVVLERGADAPPLVAQKAE